MSGALPNDRERPGRALPTRGRVALVVATTGLSLALLLVGRAALVDPVPPPGPSSLPASVPATPSHDPTTAPPAGPTTSDGRAEATARPSRAPFIVPLHSPLPGPSVQPTTVRALDGTIEAVLLSGSHYARRSFSGGGRISASGPALVIDARSDADAELTVTWRLPDESVPAAWLAGDLTVTACGRAEGERWTISVGVANPATVPSASPEDAALATPAPLASGTGSECWTLPVVPATEAIVRASVTGGTLLRIDRLEFRLVESD